MEIVILWIGKENQMKYKVIWWRMTRMLFGRVVYLIDWDKLNCEIVQECIDGLQVLKYLKKHSGHCHN